MPTYQYACTECGHAFDQVQSLHRRLADRLPRVPGPAAQGVQRRRRRLQGLRLLPQRQPRPDVVLLDARRVVVLGVETESKSETKTETKSEAKPRAGREDRVQAGLEQLVDRVLLSSSRGPVEEPQPTRPRFA